MITEQDKQGQPYKISPVIIQYLEKGVGEGATRRILQAMADGKLIGLDCLREIIGERPAVSNDPFGISHSADLASCSEHLLGLPVVIPAALNMMDDIDRKYQVQEAPGEGQFLGPTDLELDLTGFVFGFRQHLFRWINTPARATTEGLDAEM